MVFPLKTKQKAMKGQKKMKKSPTKSPKKCQMKRKGKSPKKIEKKSEKMRGNYQYHFRSALSSVIEDISGIKKSIDDRHRNQMKTTPFGTFFSAIDEGNLDSESYKKKNNELMKVLDTFDKATQKFQIGDDLLEFKAEDISVLFGILLKNENKVEKKDEKNDEKKGVKKDGNKDEKMDENPPKSPGQLFLDRNFPNSNHIKKTDINTALLKALSGEGEVEVNDSCILICCLMFCNFFFPYGSGALSKPKMVSLFEEIDTANWPQRILDELLEGASKYKDMHSAPGGCTMAVLYWLAEHVSITSMKEGKENEIPRFLRWDIPKINRAIMDIDFSAIEESKLCRSHKLHRHSELQVDYILADRSFRHSFDVKFRLSEVWKLKYWPSNVHGRHTIQWDWDVASALSTKI